MFRDGEKIAMQSILQSLFIGISIAAIPGPIFFELVRRTLSRGFIPGALLSVGEFFGNFLLLSLVFFGVSHFLTQDVVRAALFLSGAVILLYLAICAVRLQPAEIEASYDKRISHRGSVLTGFLIAVSNPVITALWVSLSGSYLSKLPSTSSALIHIFLISFGFVIFFVSLAAIVHATRSRILPKHVVLFSKVFGVILFGYAVYFIDQLGVILLR